MGVGVHTGQRCTVRLARSAGPVVLRTPDFSATTAQLELGETTRATTVRHGSFQLRTVEHLFAALGGLGVFEGVTIDVAGPELPLLDGGARAFTDALLRLGIVPSPPKLEVSRNGVVEVGASRYEFLTGATTEIVVTIDYGDAPIANMARWGGDPEDFRTRIAPARTFALEHEIAALGAAELARFADAASVVVVGRALFGAGVVEPDEPARHKLLDLIGDAYLHGGPPRGTMRVHRPGHGSNHVALRAAIDRGILRPA
ncbi:UDP-3-O-acyl-N-acetylglucosamine deacetylase [soil metagenome]